MYSETAGFRTIRTTTYTYIVAEKTLGTANGYGVGQPQRLKWRVSVKLWTFGIQIIFW